MIMTFSKVAEHVAEIQLPDHGVGVHLQPVPQISGRLKILGMFSEAR